MSVRAKLQHQWREFKNDQPGKRFENQHDRMAKESRGLLVAQTVIGALLLVGGIILLFIPGPGLLLMVFGLALIAGISRSLARLLDRAEPPVHRAAHRAKLWWKHASTAVHAALIAGAGVIASAAAFVAYRVWFA
ncbi:MAG TPA: PGPGW domain-containing protein [Kofleriaceae bacterium]|jgi:hypothetical protein